MRRGNGRHRPASPVNGVGSPEFEDRTHLVGRPSVRPAPIVLSVLALILGACSSMPSDAAAQAASPSPTTLPGPEAITDREFANLRAFARLFGYVRYFHPSDAASALDWDRFAIHGASRVRSASTTAELRERLDALFSPVAPTMQLYAAGEPSPAPDAVLTPDDTAGLELVVWQHRGVGLGNQGPYQSVRLNRDIELATPARFGSISQGMDATPYRGQEVMLEAAVRADVAGGGNQAQLWLRVDRPGEGRGFFDNMQDRPITANEWRRYRITGAVADDAEGIVVGAFLAGRGEAWFDDFRLLVRAGPGDEWTSVPLANADFEVGAVGEHPTGWNRPSPGYRSATTDAEPYQGNRSLSMVSAPPTMPATPLFDARPQPGEVAERALGDGLFVRLPLALYSRDGQTLRPPHAPSAEPLGAELAAVSLNDLSAASEALRYGNVIIAWNVFQHFYPYFDVVDVDWDAVLTETLRRAAADRTAEDFLHTLQWMVARLEDGHGMVLHPIVREQTGLPFLLERVEGEIAVVAVADPAAEACVRRGDVLVSIDGRPSDQALGERAAFVSGSPQWREYRSLMEIGRGARGSVARLALQRRDGVVTCDVVRDFDGQVQEERPSPIEELRDGVWYVDLTRSEMDDIRAMAGALARADGIIFDLRGYPNGNHEVLQHLATGPIQSAHWQVPQRIYPDQVDLVGYETAGRWSLPPMTPYWPGRIVFLTDARAISYAESVLGIVEHYRLGEIVGRATAGANGNVNPFTLPGGYMVPWTGMRVIKHDGSQHHLIGIQPTVPVARSLEGIRSGRDGDLDRALELLSAR